MSMDTFPRTEIEDLSVSRLIIGTNWFLGWSHTSRAKDRFIIDHQTLERLVPIVTTFVEAGVDTIYGVRPESPQLQTALDEVEQSTGRRIVRMGTPHFDLSGTQEAEDEIERTLDMFVEIGCSVCLPHQVTTDALVNRVTKRIDRMDRYVAKIRERGMIPGLSTHMPESIPYADGMDLDVGTYIQIYNAAGFLMQVEVDWVHRIIWNAKKPVITIKPLAAGRLLPLVGLAYSWATLRPQDMICIGCLTAEEAKEVIDISISQLERTSPQVELQTTRSKGSLR